MCHPSESLNPSKKKSQRNQYQIRITTNMDSLWCLSFFTRKRIKRFYPC